uniref:Annexin n=1 Tax=Rhabditophanes sp. KR3021 TaxID=114890 RepID=A0AC35TJE2_9BILA
MNAHIFSLQSPSSHEVLNPHTDEIPTQLKSNASRVRDKIRSFSRLTPKKSKREGRVINVDLNFPDSSKPKSEIYPDPYAIPKNITPMSGNDWAKIFGGESNVSPTQESYNLCMPPPIYQSIAASQAVFGMGPYGGSHLNSMSSYNGGDGTFNPFHMSSPWNQTSAAFACSNIGSSVYSQATTVMTTLMKKDKIVKFDKATLGASEGFDSKGDARMLRVATTASKVDKETVIKIMLRRTTRERHLIGVQYFNLYNQTLANRFKLKVKGKLYKVLKMLMECPRQKNVKDLHKALSGNCIDNALVIEMFWGKSKAMIDEVKDQYKEKYGKTVKEVIKEKSDSGYQRFLLGLIKGDRDEGALNEELVEEDVFRLYKGGEGIDGMEDEKFFLDLLAKRSYTHLTSLISKFQKLINKDIVRIMKELFVTEVREILVMFFENLSSQPCFYAKLLKEKFDDFEDHEDEVLRLLLARSEIDLEQICSEFNEISTTKIEAVVCSNSMGSLKMMLLTVLGMMMDD